MNIARFKLALERMTDLQQAKAFLHDYLAGFGFRHFAFTYYSGHIKTGKKLSYDCVSDALRPWHLHYLEQNYADVDRTLEQTYNLTIPLFWDVREQLTHAKNKREQRMRQEAIEFGIDKGMTIPVHGPNHDFVCLTLHQCLNETSMKNYQQDQFEWVSATQFFYHYIKKLLNLTTETIYHLTRREEQCLVLTAKAWRVEQIAKELKISPRTVNFHIQNANQKIGTNNKYQATYKYFELMAEKK